MIANPQIAHLKPTRFDRLQVDRLRCPTSLSSVSAVGWLKRRHFLKPACGLLVVLHSISCCTGIFGRADRKVASTSAVLRPQPRCLVLTAGSHEKLDTDA